MKILVIDGQGGGIGKSLVEKLRASLPEAEIIAAGTNSIATTGMLKAGATIGATGENAVVYNCTQADVIAGPIGIAFANAMYGEITPAMAYAVSDNRAKAVLIPVAKCGAPCVVGVTDKPLAAYIAEAVEIIARLAGK